MCIASWRATSGRALAVDQHADLLRRWVDVLGERLAGAGREAAGADDLDVLAEAGAESSTRSVSRPGRPRPLRSRRPCRAPSGRTQGESSFFETGSVSQPTATIAPVVSPSIRVRTMPSFVSRSARLATEAMPFFAQQLDGRVEVALRLLKRALAVHHPRRSSRRGVASPLLPRCRSFGHLDRGLGARARLQAPPVPRVPQQPRPRMVSASAAGSSFRATSAGVTFCLPASIPSATVLITSEQERIASSLLLDHVLGLLVRVAGWCRRGRSPAGRDAAPRARRAAPCGGRR